MSKYLPFSLLPFIVIGVLLVYWVYQQTSPVIALQAQQKKQQRLQALIPETDSQLKQIELPATQPLITNQQGETTAWAICQKPLITETNITTKAQGLIIQVVTIEGYAADIQLLVGLDQQLTITGVDVLQHAETPGLGDKIEIDKSNWLQQFIGHNLNSIHWQLSPKSNSKSTKPYFDSITAATITSKAVINVLKQSLEQLSLTAYQTIIQQADLCQLSKVKQN